MGEAAEGAVLGEIKSAIVIFGEAWEKRVNANVPGNFSSSVENFNCRSKLGWAVWCVADLSKVFAFLKHAEGSSESKIT